MSQCQTANIKYWSPKVQSYNPLWSCTVLEVLRGLLTQVKAMWRRKGLWNWVLKSTFINPKSRHATVFPWISRAPFSGLNQFQKYIIHGYSKGTVNHLRFWFSEGCDYQSSHQFLCSVYLLSTHCSAKATDVPVFTFYAYIGYLCHWVLNFLLPA